MFSRRYLQNQYFIACIVVLSLSGCLSEFPDDEDVRLPLASSFNFSHNETDSSGKIFQGSPTASSSNEIYNGTREDSSATPTLSTALPSSTVSAPKLAERSTVTITPSSVSPPSMIITATRVTLDHRMGSPPSSSSVESNDGGSNEVTSSVGGEDISTTDFPMNENFSPEKISSSSSERSNEVNIGGSSHTSRHARFHRIHEDRAQNIEVDESVTEPSISSSTGPDFQDTTATDSFRENEADGGDSFGDFQEDNNEIPEQLPTPLALINPNGEGNNPPLEDDFAEAFKKVNANGKRRRFRGGRRNRLKMKKQLNETKEFAQVQLEDQPPAPPPPPPSQEQHQDQQKQEQEEQQQQQQQHNQEQQEQQQEHQPQPTPDISTSASNQQEIHQSQFDRQNEPEDDIPQTPSTPKYRRFRTTTSSPLIMRSTTTTTTESPNNEGSSPIVRHGPKPMILKNVQPVGSNSVTPSPQLEKPSGHTEKISTYFFSTPSPSARLRLRQKIRESYPSSTTTTTTTTTTTESPVPLNSYPSGDGHEVWKNDFPDFQRNSYFAGPSTNNFKIPAFVPLNLGLEQDEQQQEQVENSITRPDSSSTLENKAYYVTRNHHNHHHSDSSSSTASSPSAPSRGNNDYYASSSTTPRPRTRHHSFTRHRTTEYETASQPTPTAEPESSGPEYYPQSSNSEPSSTFSSAQRQTTGSHYDRTKDRVIFYNDSPYSAQHSPAPPSSMEPPLESTPGTSSQTLSGHFSVSEDPNIYENAISSSTGDSSQAGLFTRGKVYSEESPSSHIDSPFKNGPPDASHIHSPNIEHQMSPPSSTDSEHGHLSHSHPYHYNHNAYPEPSIAQHPPGPSLGGSYSHAHIETSHTQGPGDSAVYGTVEEVPAHGASFEHSPPPPHHLHHHYHHHGMHPSSGPIPYPFGSPSQYAPSSISPYPPPPPSSLMSPPEINNNIYDPSLPSPHPPPPPPPPPPPYYPHEYAPSYEVQSENSNDNDNQPDSHFPLSPSHLAGSPTEIVHGSVSPISSPPSSGDDPSSNSVGQIPTNPEPVHSPSPDFPMNSINNESPPSPPAGDEQSLYNGPQIVDHNYPLHTHTMSTHADYEPANPPLPHDHPFHKNFIPFPTQDLHGAISLANIEQDHPSQDTNAIIGSGQYHPGTVESVPTGRPAFQPSPLIPSKPKQPLEFTPIPEDVKDNDIYNSFPSKPYDGPPPPPHGPNPQDPSTHHHHHHHHPHGSPGSEIHDLHHHHHHHHSLPHHPPHLHPSDEHLNPYLSTGPSGESHSPYPAPGEHGKDSGYSGPVNEIHSGIYSQSSADHSAHAPDGKSPFSHDSSSPHDAYKPPSGGLAGLQEKPHGPNDGPPGLHSIGHDMSDGPSGFPGPGLHGQQDKTKEHQSSNDGKKGQKGLKAAFSNTPYVLMFPQLIPEDKMRPSPPTVLSNEIPVVQASSMTDFTSGSGEKPPLGPGFQAVPVHPRDQMYQVLAKTHYEKMMEKYREAKRKPPSAIYTPYGILVPVGTNVDAASSMQHNVFAKRPPKLRGEKSLLNALLGSASSTSSRFFPPNGMNNKFSKMMELEPAIDLLAEKLAMKIISAQHVIGKAKAKSERSKDGKVDSPYLEQQELMTMESKSHATLANPEMKDVLKGVLKGHFTEMVESTVSEEDRRSPSISTKFLNSFFRKGRISPAGPMPPNPMMSMPSPSLSHQNKVPPPPGMPPLQGMQDRGVPPPPSHHSGIGPPFPPPQLSMPMQQGPGGLLGTIRRLFSFGPPERHDMGMGPNPNFANFASRTLYTGNGNNSSSKTSYVDGPSPRSSHFPSHMLQQYPMPHSKMMTISPSVPFNISVVQKNFNSSNKQMVLPTAKPSKKKKKTATTSDKKPTNGNRLTPGSSFFNKNSTNLSSVFNSSTTPPPTILMSKSSFFSQNKNNSIATSSDKKPIAQSSNLLNSPFMVDTSLKSIVSNLRNENNPTNTDPASKQDTTTTSFLNQATEKLPTLKPFDVFQTLLGSTRSVLNFFKSEARKNSGPTVLIPRSGSFRKRRSLLSL